MLHKCCTRQRHTTRHRRARARTAHTARTPCAVRATHTQPVCTCHAPPRRGICPHERTRHTEVRQVQRVCGIRTQECVHTLLLPQNAVLKCGKLQIPKNLLQRSIRTARTRCRLRWVREGESALCAGAAVVVGAYTQLEPCTGNRSNLRENRDVRAKCSRLPAQHGQPPRR